MCPNVLNWALTEGYLCCRGCGEKLGPSRYSLLVPGLPPPDHSLSPATRQLPPGRSTRQAGGDLPTTLGLFSHSLGATPFSSQPPRISTMDARRRDVTLASLNAAIEAMNFAKEIAGITPAKAVFGSVGVVLIMIRVSFLPIHFYPPQADVCRIL